MRTLTFKDFTWRSIHHIPTKFGAAATPHWHTYRARLFFEDAPDQDMLSRQIENHFVGLHGCALNAYVTPDTSDESVAAWLLQEAQKIGKCVKVVLENDYQRGAEISL